jgi:hypothetical protein
MSEWSWWRANGSKGQGVASSQLPSEAEHSARVPVCFYRFLLGFDPEYGGYMSFQNVTLPLNYTALLPIRPYSPLIT